MIFYLEDDDYIREMVVYALTQAGMPAWGLPNASALWAALEQKMPDLVLLDVMLPGEDGFKVLHKLRENRRTARIPVIMVTALGGEQERVAGLEGGADDYIAKPFTMAELTARVRALLRRCADAPVQKNLLSCGSLQMNLPAHSVQVNGREVRLTLKEFALLRLLMENEGEILSSEALMQQAWGDAGASDHTLRVHIQNLRQKIAPSGVLLENVHGKGYRLEKKEISKGEETK